MEEYEYYYAFPADEPEHTYVRTHDVDEVAHEIALKHWTRPKLTYTLAQAMCLIHKLQAAQLTY